MEQFSQREMVRAFPEFYSERKKRAIAGGCPQFPKRFSGNFFFGMVSTQSFSLSTFSFKAGFRPRINRDSLILQRMSDRPVAKISK